MISKKNSQTHTHNFPHGDDKYPFSEDLFKWILIYRPHKAGVSAQQYKDYQEVRKPSKNPVVYQQQKFTPFLESNALPGAFRLVFKITSRESPCMWLFCRPIMNHQSHQPSPYYQESGSIEVDDQPPPPSDFSAIYDKLAQLKLRFG